MAARSKAKKSTKKRKAKKGSTGPTWSKLKHAKGGARSVPALIDRLTSGGDATADALSALADALTDASWRGAPRKTLYSASGPSLAALAAKLPEVGNEHRAACLELMLTMLQLRRRTALLGRGFDLEDASTKRRYAGKDGKALVDAACEAAPHVAELLCDELAAVRELAALFLGLIPGASEASAAALEALLQTEELDEVRARAIFSLGYLGRPPRVDTGGPLSAGACTLAGWHASGRAGSCDDTVVAFFAATVPLAMRADRAGARELDRQALAILGDGVMGEAGRAVAVNAVVATLAALDPAAARMRHGWPNTLVGWYLPRRRFGRDPLSAADLDDAQRSMLVALHVVPHGGSDFDSRGLPQDFRCRRRVLGLDPPTVLEDVISCPRVDKKRDIPRWKATYAAFLKDTSLDDDRAPRVRALVADKYFSDLDDEGWLELCTEMLARSYSLGIFSHQVPMIEAMQAVSKKQRKVWRERYVAACRQPFNVDLHRRIGWALAWSAVDDLGEGRALPADLDDVVGIQAPAPYLRQLFECIPGKRREAIAAREVALFAPDEHRFAATIVEQLIDLVPEATTALLDQWGHIRDFVNKTFGKARKKHARVDELIERYQAAAKVDPPRRAKRKAIRKRGGAMKVELKNKREPDDVGELSAVEKKQLAACGELYDGERLPANKRLHAVDVPEEGNFYGEALAIWDVYVKGKHAYDAWVYMVDSGVVFARGTTDVELSCIQFDWSAGGGDPALAKAIEKAIEQQR